MRAAALGGVWLAVSVMASCGGSGAPSSATRSATPTPTPVTTGTILPSTAPSATARGDTLVAVLQSSSGNPFQSDAVALLGLDGAIRAKAAFKARRLPDLGNVGPLLTPEARVAGGKVFYWDGDGVVHTLGADGKIAEVTRFPLTQPQQELSVAVSPDGSRLMAALLTLPPPPVAPTGSQGGNRAFDNAAFSIDVYSATTGKASNRVSHQDGTVTGINPSIPVLQMDTWDSAGPIASYPVILGTQGGGPHEWNGPLVQLDANGTPVGPVGGSDCPADDIAPDSTYICVDRTTGGKMLRVVAPDGRRLWSHQAGSGSYYYPFLAPGHSRALALENNGVVVGADGSSTALPAGFFHVGWIDDQTVIGTLNAARDLQYVRLSQVSKTVGLGTIGTYVGSL